MRVHLRFKWSDLRMGIYWDHSTKTLYVRPLPMIGLHLQFCRHKDSLFVRNIHADEAVYTGARSMFFCPDCGEIVYIKELKAKYELSSDTEITFNARECVTRHDAYAVMAIIQSIDWAKITPLQQQALRSIMAVLVAAMPIKDNTTLKNSLGAVL